MTPKPEWIKKAAEQIRDEILTVSDETRFVESCIFRHYSQAHESERSVTGFILLCNNDPTALYFDESASKDALILLKHHCPEDISEIRKGRFIWTETKPEGGEKSK